MNTLPAECATDLEQRNRVIAQANDEISVLQASGCFGGARETIHGVEITIDRPSGKNGHVTRSYRIIPWR